MGALLRLTLAASLVLLGSGTLVAPHERAGGWTHQGLDHPLSAVHSTLLEHLRYLAQRAEPPVSGTSFVSAPVSFASTPVLSALASTVLAVVAVATPRIWRPSPLGVHAIAVALARAQLAAGPAHAPPRASFSS